MHEAKPAHTIFAGITLLQVIPPFLAVASEVALVALQTAVATLVVEVAVAEVAEATAVLPMSQNLEQ